MIIKERRKNGSLSVAFHNIDENGEILPSKTIQSSKDECDVNLIIARHKKGIMNTHFNSKKGVYADLSQAPTYQEALQTIINANEAFDTLPASTRKRFGNDPQNFLEFMHDPKNLEEAVKLGLTKTTPNLNQNKSIPVPDPVPNTDLVLSPKS